MLFDVRIEGNYYTVAANSSLEAIEKAKEKFTPAVVCVAVCPCESVNGEGKCPHPTMSCSLCARHYIKGDIPNLTKKVD